MFLKYIEAYLKGASVNKIKNCSHPLLIPIYRNSRQTLRTVSRIRNKINSNKEVLTNENNAGSFRYQSENISKGIQTETITDQWTNNKDHSICFTDTDGLSKNKREKAEDANEYENEDENEIENENENETAAGIEETKDNDIIADKYRFIFERPKYMAHIDDEPIIRRPGCIIDIKTLLRNNWSFPAVGFNSRLEIPVYKFETDENDEHYNKIKFINVPSDIFGLPIRSDILHKCYYFYRTALAGYTERMQLYKWEWPGSTKKYRSQKKSGKARMNWRKTSGRYLGVKNHPIRPHDQRTRINRKFLWKGLKIMLSAKFAQDEIKVVDNFLIKSHKTKYTVKYLRNILGKKCNSALLIHEGKTDVNNNFLWACANIASVKRENVEGVNIYNLLKYRYVIFTYKALQNLIYEIKVYPYKNRWMPTYATPNNTKAPIPEKVNNWNLTWEEKKKRNNFAYFNKEDLKKRIQEWKWSSDLKGALKIKRKDPYKNFILTKFQYQDPLPEYIRYEYLFQTEDDTEPFNESENLQMIEEMLNEEDEFLSDVSELSSSPLTLKSNDNICDNMAVSEDSGGGEEEGDTGEDTEEEDDEDYDGDENDEDEEEDEDKEEDEDDGDTNNNDNVDEINRPSKE